MGSDVVTAQPLPPPTYRQGIGTIRMPLAVSGMLFNRLRAVGSNVGSNVGSKVGSPLSLSLS